jgi:hypothetical protein
MKKTLIVAALSAAALLSTPTFAADMAEAPAVDGKCYIFPLLPDCAAQWNDAWAAKGFHASIPVAWWTCKKAEDAAHLLDCESGK